MGGFSDKLKIGEIIIEEPRNGQEWMRELLKIILDSGNGGRTGTKVKQKDLPRITKKGGKYVKYS